MSITAHPNIYIYHRAGRNVYLNRNVQNDAFSTEMMANIPAENNLRLVCHAIKDCNQNPARTLQIYCMSCILSTGPPDGPGFLILMM